MSKLETSLLVGALAFRLTETKNCAEEILFSELLDILLQLIVRAPVVLPIGLDRLLVLSMAEEFLADIRFR